MSAYGKVISGGAAMTKGVSKGINDKLDERKKEYARRDKVAGAVVNAYKVDTLSTQHVQTINGGSFVKGTRPAKV